MKCVCGTLCMEFLTNCIQDVNPVLNYIWNDNFIINCIAYEKEKNVERETSCKLVF